MHKILILGADNPTLHLLMDHLKDFDVFTEQDPEIFKQSIYVEDKIDKDLFQSLEKLFIEKSYETLTFKDQYIEDHYIERYFYNFVEPKTSLRHYHKFTKPYNRNRNRRYC